jgi:hypothetical protein
VDAVSKLRELRIVAHAARFDRGFAEVDSASLLSLMRGRVADGAIGSAGVAALGLVGMNAEGESPGLVGVASATSGLGYVGRMRVLFVLRMAIGASHTCVRCSHHLLTDVVATGANCICLFYLHLLLLILSG